MYYTSIVNILFFGIKLYWMKGDRQSVACITSF